MGKVLQEKVAVVTGGGSGIGEAIARRFAAEGYRVVVAGRHRVPIETLAKEIGGVSVVANVTAEAEVAALFRACDEAYGRLDVLVNNAGSVGAMSDLAAMDMAAWDHTIAVNLRGVVLCVKEAIPLLRRQGGAIVNISSRGGLHGSRAGASDYVASKFAVTGVTESLAQELGPWGIRINDVCPGVVDTEMSRRSLEAMGRELEMAAAEVLSMMFAETAALGRLVEAEEVAAVALFLAGDGASAITGAHLKVDCGRR
ncbi:MAG: SDR family NAD(P)-dependent oxidoreductase [Rhodospirillales bacterium]|nr:SDR family NAD(P)-dependent oxidoreductase [Rhodospirillales bacterium]